MSAIFFVFLTISSAFERGSAQEFGVPKTSFTCQGRVPGYYADIETGCRTYHVCDGTSQFSYVCPPRTLFQPAARICDHWYLVECLEEEEEERAEAEEDEAEEGETKSPGDGGDALNSLDPSPGSLDAFDGFNGTSPFNVAGGNEEYSEKVNVVNSGEESTFIYPAAEYNSTEPATAAARATSVPEPTTAQIPTKNGNESPPSRKVFSFQLKDFRYLFYIPQEKDENPPTESSTNLILVANKGSLLKFRGTSKHMENGELPCPAYCNPRFIVSGTCHPCIMIK